MRAAEQGFLLLTSSLGDPQRKPLSTAQMRTLADRAWQLEMSEQERELAEEDLLRLGYGRELAQRILTLLAQEDLLEHYLHRAKKAGCTPLTRISDGYPIHLRRRMGLDSPGVLWAKGDLQLLRYPMISLVGSRDLRPANRAFAEEVGRQAALQGYTLVSGNARGADRCAQESCLEAGGRVISVVADKLADHPQRPNVLYLSEEDFDQDFTAQRALSRNRVIHALGEKTLAAQCTPGAGGTWDGTVKNLRFGWSPVFCFDDGSEAMLRLEQMGAELICQSQLQQLQRLSSGSTSLFDRD